MSDPVPSTNGREALRGAEVLAFDLVFEVLSSQQLAELLTAPLERAAARGERDLAQRLVRAGAGIGDALHEAVRGGYGDIVSDLVGAGASVDAKDAYGYTPLHVAARCGETDSEVAQLLMLKGADKDAFDNDEETPLYHAVYYWNSAIVLALLTAGADASVRCGATKNTVIHIAAERGNIEILQAVIEHGADVEAVDVDQTTALHYAGAFNDTEAVDALVGAGANIEARDRDGHTPLHIASFVQNHEAVLCLLKHGANVNAHSNDLQTTLMHSTLNAGTRGGAAEVVDSLLRAGADETIVNEDGSRAVDMIGKEVEEQDFLEDVERMRELLANAPADRAWRRRGYLVLCRAHPDRVQQGQVAGGTHRADTRRRAGSCAEMAQAGEVVGDSRVDENTDGDWAVVVSMLLQLEEEGIFRTIVGYL